MATASREGIPQDDGRLPDGELARRVREEHSREAFAFLAGRHLGWVMKVIARWAWDWGLRGADIEDAQGDGAFALYPAVEQFAPDRNCSFRTFLRWKAWGRFWNFIHRLCRAERVYERSGRAASLVEGGADGYLVAGDGEDDPVAVAEQHELLAHLEQVLDEYGDRARQLWEGRLADRSLHELAPELGLSYDQTMLLNHKVEVALQDRLHDLST